MLALESLASILHCRQSDWKTSSKLLVVVAVKNAVECCYIFVNVE
jgi:hypothetical protein